MIVSFMMYKRVRVRLALLAEIDGGDGDEVF